MRGGDNGFMSEIYKNKFSFKGDGHKLNQMPHDEFIKEIELSSLKFQSLETIIFYFILLGIFFYADVIVFSNVYTLCYIIFGLLSNLVVHFLSNYTNMEASVIKILSELLFFLIFSTKTIFISGIISIKDITDYKRISTIILTSALFFLGLIIYNFKKNKKIFQLTQRLIYYENMNNVHVTYTDNLINKMFCLFFTWSENKFFFNNKSACDFLEHKFYNNPPENKKIEPNNLKYMSSLSEEFISELKLNYVNNEINTDFSLINQTNRPVNKIIKYFETKPICFENYLFYFIGIAEYLNQSTGDKNYFNLFIRKVEMGKSIWIEVMMYDITLMKKIESADQLIKLKEKILSKIAHEFKTPLICVISLAEEIHEKLEGSLISNIETANDFSLKKKVGHVRDLSNYILYLISDIAQYLNKGETSSGSIIHNINNQNYSSYKIKSTYQPKINLMQQNNFTYVNLNYEKTSVYEILNFCFKILKCLLIYNKGKIKFISPIKDFEKVKNLKIITDPLRIKQIILNLISNAVKFTQCGSITLKAKIVREFLKIQVVDTGIGIRKEDIGKIFKDFRMLEEHINMNSFGTGLGLSISRSLAEQFGYLLKVESIFGQGSNFILAIKLIEEKTPSHGLNFTESQDLPKFYDSNLIDPIIVTKNKTLSTNMITKKNFMKDFFFHFERSGSASKVSKEIKKISKKNSIKSKFNSQISNKSEIVENNFDGNELSSNSSAYDSSDTVKLVYDPYEKPIYVENTKSIIKKSHNIKMHLNDFDLLKIIHRLKTNTNKEIFSEEKIVFDNLNKLKEPKEKNILIIDDNILILDQLENTLKKCLEEHNLGEYKVIRGSDGVDLLRYIVEDQKLNNRIKCVIVDEFMEFLNGSEAINILRNMEMKNKLKPTPIVKFTSDVSMEPSLGPNILILSKPASKNNIAEIMKKLNIIKSNITH